MKTIKTALLALTLLAGVFGATAAQAYPGHFYGGGRVGVFVDPWPLFYPGWGYGYGYNPYYAYPSVVVAQPTAPTVYVEQNQQAAPAQSSDWYYCRKPAGYYPYVRNCEKAWERVPSQPPAPPQQ
jgi:hypothetical protein